MAGIISLHFPANKAQIHDRKRPNWVPGLNRSQRPDCAEIFTNEKVDKLCLRMDSAY